MDKRNTATWLRKREVASLMHVNTQTVDRYQEQGLLPGKRLFGGRIVIFRKSDVESLMETLQTQGKEHPEEQEHAVNRNYKEES